jgi:dihydrolipoamide dehydrogenase
MGRGAIRVQIASIFDAFGSRVTLVEPGPRILRTEDEVAAAADGATL